MKGIEDRVASLSDGERGLLDYLEAVVDDSSIVRMAQEKLATEMGVQRQTVARWIVALEMAGLVERARNRRSVKVLNNHKVTDNCSKCSKCSMVLKPQEIQWFTDKCSKCSMGNVRSEPKSAIPSLSLLRSYNVLLDPQAGLRMASPVPELAALSVEDYFLQLFPQNPLYTSPASELPAGIVNGLHRAVARFGDEVVRLALDDLSTTTKRKRRNPTPSIIWRFCETIAARKMKQAKEGEQRRPYDRPVEPKRKALTDEERAASLAAFNRKVIG